MSEIKTFDHIPQARELMSNGGLPGVIYHQVAAQNLIKGREEGFKQVHGVEPYRIVGPEGTVDCILLSEGVPIRGQSGLGGARRVYVDQAIFDGTGLPDRSRPAEEPKASPAPKAKATVPKPSQPTV